MLLTSADRTQIISALRTSGIERIVELGVYKGEFAEFCWNTLSPKRHVLIDFWEYDRYGFELRDAPQNAEREEIFKVYFDGAPREVLRRAYEDVVARFTDRIGSEVIKEDIAIAADRFEDGSFDLIYLDGNHSYEYVLRDLHLWYPKLTPGGLFVCNDFFESPLAAKQNLGVIPAYLTFAKRFQTFPLALSTREWSDFYFSNQAESPIIEKLKIGLTLGGHVNIEVNSELLGAYHHKIISSPQGQFLLPSFRSL